MNLPMKKSKNLISLFIISILIIACGGTDTPRSVADKFLSAMSKQDFEDAKKYGTEETAKLLDMMNGFAKMSNDSAFKDTKYEITRETADGDNAIIYYKEEGKEGELQLPIVKVNGKWKVLLSKESINSSDSMNAIDMGATNTDTTGK
jgi:hypothetical protein